MFFALRLMPEYFLFPFNSLMCSSLICIFFNIFDADIDF